MPIEEKTDPTLKGLDLRQARSLPDDLCTAISKVEKTERENHQMLLGIIQGDTEEVNV